METNIIYNEDCRLTLDRLPDNSVDLFLQDTPFGCTQNKWDIKPDLKEMWKHWLRVGKPTAAYIFFATQPFASELIMSNLKMFRYDVIWNKGDVVGHLNANKMPLRQHEIILVFYKSTPTYNPQKTYTGRKYHSKFKLTDNVGGSNYGKAKSVDNSELNKGFTFPTSIISTVKKHASIVDHPTEKPIDLIRYLVRTYSNPNDIVFDGYCGSGTLAEAAIIEGRQFICAENDTTEGYYDHAIKRVKNRLMKPELFAA